MPKEKIKTKKYNKGERFTEIESLPTAFKPIFRDIYEYLGELENRIALLEQRLGEE